MRQVVSSVLALALVGCGGGGDAPDRDGAEPESTVPKLAASFSSEWQPIWSIGALTEPPSQVFGVVADLELDDDGRTYVLDSQFADLRVFAEEGELIARVGGSGKGPGEFILPNAVEAYGTSVFVADRVNLRISVFDWVGSELVFRDSWNLDYIPDDLCVQDGLVTVYGLSEGNLIHRYTDQGEHVVSFGEPVDPENPILRNHLNGGILACGQDGRVYAAPTFVPSIALFDSSGTRVWETDLPEFVSLEYEENPENRTVRYFLGPAGGHHFNRSILVLDGRVLSQAAWYDPTVGSIFEAAYGRRTTLSRETGQVLHTAEGPVFLAGDDKTALGFAVDAYPTVEAFKRIKDVEQ